MPWRERIALIAAASPVASTGRSPFAHETMLRIHFLQQWFGLSGLAMEETMFETPLYRDFAGFSGTERIPDRVSILRFRHLLEEHQLSLQILATVNSTLASKGLLLKSGTAIGATLIAAPGSTKNSSGERDPEMHQTKKGNQWHFGMKAHIGVDADARLVHTVVGTAANVNDITQARALVHGDGADVFADSGYQGVAKREETQGIKANRYVAMRPGKRKVLVKATPMWASPSFPDTSNDMMCSGRRRPRTRPGHLLAAARTGRGCGQPQSSVRVRAQHRPFGQDRPINALALAYYAQTLAPRPIKAACATPPPSEQVQASGDSC